MSKLSKDVDKLRGLNDEDQNPAGSGRGGMKRRRGRGKGSNPHRGPRKPKELTGPIKLRLGKATQLFIGQQHEEAMALVDEVIGINSETYEAWTLKASLFQERGNIESAMVQLCCSLPRRNWGISCFISSKGSEMLCQCSEMPTHKFRSVSW
jgi:hypothetical protein